MNIEPIEMDREKAREAFENYRAAVRKRHDNEDEMIMRGYKFLMKGYRVIDIVEAIKHTGLNEEGRPRLAIAGATAKEVMLYQGHDDITYYWGKALHKFSSWGKRFNYSPNVHATRSLLSIPIKWPRDGRVVTPAPNVPPQYRPARGMQHLRVLWEVEQWEEVPFDPFLLKPIGGHLYAVLAAWDLTQLERTVLSGTRAVN